MGIPQAILDFMALFSVLLEFHFMVCFFFERGRTNISELVKLKLFEKRMQMEF